jgi:hypothetical protein
MESTGKVRHDRVEQFLDAEELTRLTKKTGYLHHRYLDFLLAAYLNLKGL